MNIWPNLSRLDRWIVRNGDSVHAWEHCQMDKGLKMSDLDIDKPTNMQKLKASSLSNATSC